MDWFALSLIATLAYAVSNLFVKVGLHHETVDPVAFGCVFQMLVAAYTIPWLILQPPQVPAEPIMWGLVVLSCLFYTVATFFWFRAIKMTPVSEVTILMSTRPLWVFMAGVVLGREAASVSKFGLMLFVLVGLVIVFYEKGKFRFGAPERITLLGTLFFSGASVIDSYLSTRFSANIYTFFTFFLPSLGILAMDPAAIGKMRTVLGRRSALGLVSSTLILLLSVACMLTAYKYGEASRVLSVNQLSAIIVVLLGAVILKERSNLGRKLAGSVIVVAGVALLRF